MSRPGESIAAYGTQFTVIAVAADPVEAAERYKQIATLASAMGLFVTRGITKPLNPEEAGRHDDVQAELTRRRTTMFGPRASDSLRGQALEHATLLAEGDVEKGHALIESIEQRCGYLPRAFAGALVETLDFATTP